MSYPADLPTTVFDGGTAVANGPLAETLSLGLRYVARLPEAVLVAYSDATGERLDIDWSGDEQAVLQRLLPAAQMAPATPVHDARRGPGRPRLGVVAREVTLLPRHWEWLNAQSGGASAALRRLIDEARRTSEARESQRRAQDAAYRFMHAAGGDLPGYEEALRALYAGDAVQFDAQLAAWPPDWRNHALRLGFGPR